VKCTEFLNELSDFLDGSIEPKLYAELQEHLQWCSQCFVVCDTTRKTIQIYRENEIYELPDDLRSRLHAAILEKCRKSKPGDAPPDA
jgi:predicted anti-sigma-YlaC factor YlaD